jgi:hypothetical protein
MIDRIAALEAQAAALAAEIAALRAGQTTPAPSRPPRDERSVSVVPLLIERADGLPNLVEVRKLHAAVRNLVPEAKHHDPDAAFRGFSGAYDS